MSEKGKIPFEDLLKRTTGLSTPLFCVTWSPADSERDVAKRLLTILEDEGLLFGDYRRLHDLGGYAEKALHRLHDRLSEELSPLDRETPLVKSFYYQNVAIDLADGGINVAKADLLRGRSRNTYNIELGEFRRLKGTSKVTVKKTPDGYQIDSKGILTDQGGREKFTKNVNATLIDRVHSNVVRGN